MQQISSQYEAQLLSVGLKVATPLALGGQFAFNRPCAVGANTKLMASQLNCYSTIGENVVALATNIGRYTTVQNHVQLGNVVHDGSHGLTSACFHQNPVFSYAAQQQLPPSNDLAIETILALSDKPAASDSISNCVTIAPLADSLLRTFPNIPLDQDVHFLHVGHDVWIGEYVCVNQPVTIGNGAIIKPGAVITKDVPAYAIVEGFDVVTGYRFADELIADLQAVQWWQYDLPEMLKQGQPVPVQDPAALVQFFKDTDPQHLLKLEDHWLFVQPPAKAPNPNPA